MPGSGKSYFGKQLAEHLSWPFFDLDHEIEIKEEKTIHSIFTSEGEDYFRRSEAETLRGLSRDHKTMILSTGGGTPCFHEGINYMNENGITVFLETSLDVLIERLSNKTHRPLIQGEVEKNVTDLLAKRMKYYQQARITIDHHDPDLLISQLRDS